MSPSPALVPFSRSPDEPPSALALDITKRRPEVRLSAGWAIRLLVVEDDPASVGGAARLLQQRGFVVTTAPTLAEAMRMLTRRSFQVMLIDTTGGEHRLARLTLALRRESDIPVCIVSPTSDEREVVIALELGADAVVRKPVRPDELTARLVTLVRRASPVGSAADVVRCGDIEVDPSLGQVRVAGNAVELNSRECTLLMLLLQRPDRALTREHLVEQLWGDGDPGHFKALSGYIQRLRDVVEVDPSAPQRLLTIRGYGYRFVTSLTEQLVTSTLDRSSATSLSARA